MYNNLLIMLIGISTIILIPIMIYCRGFLLGKITNTIHNSPENTITKRALHTMQTFDIVEAIDIQNHTKNKNKNKKKHQTAKWLKYLTISSLLCTIALVVFFISINLSISYIMTLNVGIDFMLIVIFILCYFWLFNEIHTDSLADKALNCLKVNSKTLTLEEKNKCIDIILRSEHTTFRLVHCYSEFIPADRLDECYNCTKKL